MQDREKQPGLVRNAHRDFRPQDTAGMLPSNYVPIELPTTRSNVRQVGDFKE